MLIVWYMFSLAATKYTFVQYVLSLHFVRMSSAGVHGVPVPDGGWFVFCVLVFGPSMALEKQRHYETETLTQTNSKQKESKPH